MKILLIHHRLPFPLDSGMDKLRYNLISILSKRYDVSLAVPINKNTKPEWIEHIRSCVDELIAVPVNKTTRKNVWLYSLRYLRLILFRRPVYATESYHKELKDRLVDLTNEKKFYFIQLLSDFSACYLPYLSCQEYLITGPMDDMIESSCQNYRLERKFISKLGIKFSHRAMKKHFSVICKRSSLVLFHSVEDMKRVKSVLGFDFISMVLPVTTDHIEKAEEPSNTVEPNSLVFVGGMGTFFNQDAAIHLVKDILPAIRKKIPDVKLYLVGNHPSASIIELGADKNIIVTGEVPDIRPYVRKAAVYISTARTGTGIKTKIIEALSMSKAMVVSSSSLQGLWETDDSIFICDNDNEFAETTVRLLQNLDLRKKHEKGSAELYNRAYAFSKAESMTSNCYSSIEQKIHK